jgi:hypothetical protein
VSSPRSTVITRGFLFKSRHASADEDAMIGAKMAHGVCAVRDGKES